MSSGPRPLPRTPLLDWSSFTGARRAPGVHSIDDLGHYAVTTSGRAAIYQALLQLRLEPGSVVLVPTYHCPTMIAPVILAKLEVAYFAIRADGLPNLDTIDPATVSRARAILVSHYFGRARSLASVRQWCDEHRIALIEDCAHCYFGDAGERPVGTWGDFATASLTKFFPVPEGGVLVSARTPLATLALAPQGFKAQLKSWLDVLELAITHGRFAGINWLFAGLLQLKNHRHRAEISVPGEASATADNMLLASHMGRSDHAPVSATILLHEMLPRAAIVARRRRNFGIYVRHLAQLQGAHTLYDWPVEDSSVPYAFPLWVDDADGVYQGLREQRLPVFRWDRVWPGTPRITDDLGPSWSHHVLQFLCHQDLSEADVTRTALATRRLLSQSRTSQ